MKEYQHNHIKMWKAFKKKVEDTNYLDLPKSVGKLKYIVIKSIIENKDIKNNCFLCEEAQERMLLDLESVYTTDICNFCPSEDFNNIGCCEPFENIRIVYYCYLRSGDKESLETLLKLIDKMINIECD